jgi:hypothetical protein
MHKALYDYEVKYLSKMTKKEFREYMIQTQNQRVEQNKNNHPPVKDK